MRKRRSVQHGMQGAFVFVLLGLFALMSILLVLYGSQMYRTTVAYSEVNNEQRVLSSYIRSMVRAEDAAGAVRVEEKEGIPVISLYEDINGTEYVTWIYTWEGTLYEQFTGADRPFVPEHGTMIAKAADLSAQIEDGVLHVELLNEKGENVAVQVALYCV